MKKRTKSMIGMMIVISMILSLFSEIKSEAYGTAGTDDEQQSVPYAVSEYDDASNCKIITKSELVFFNYKKPHDNPYYITFPREGKVEWKCEPESIYWAFNTMNEQSDNYCIRISEFPKTVTAGSYFVELMTDNHYDWDKYYPNALLTYTYYPLCKVYYIDDGESGEIGSFYVQKKSQKMSLPTGSLPDEKIKGYRIEGWYEDRALTKQAVVDMSVGKDYYFYPKKTAIDYSVTYDLDGGINADKNPASYTIEDGIIELSEPTRVGYRFMGWYSDPLMKTKVDTIDATQCKDVTLYAKWEEHKYNIVYEDGGDTNENPDTYTLNDKDIVLMDAARLGYTFAGWYFDKEHSQQAEKIDTGKLEDITIYGAWHLNQYSVSYELNEGSIDPAANITSYTVEDEDFVLQLPERELYNFAGWYKDEALTERVEKIDTSWCEDLVLYAKWEEHPFAITYENGGDHTNPLSYTYTDETIVLKDAIRKGYSFEGWYLDEDHTRKIDEINPGWCEDITIYGAWTPITYHVKYEMDDGTNSKENITEYVAEDPDFELKEATKTGCTFDGWYMSEAFGEGTKVDTIRTDMCQDITLYAKWQEEDVVYSILSDTKILGYISDNFYERDLYMEFPTSGKVSFQSSNNSNNSNGLFSFDDKGSESNAANLSGTVSAGTHNIHFTGLLGSKKVSYTYYPLCKVYYVYENVATELSSYYLSKYTKKEPIIKPDIKGYKILDFYRDRDLTAKITTIDESVGKDWYLYPKVEPIVYSVSYDMDGGTNSDENITSYTIEDGDFTLKTPVKTGYTFGGWYTSPGLTSETRINKITTSDCKNLTLYVKWSKKSETEIPSPIATPFSSDDLRGPRTGTGGVVTWDCIYFGYYWQNDTNGDGEVDRNDAKDPIKWRVLSVNGDIAFLLADQNLDCQPYNRENDDVTWNSCTLRQWLNGEFYGNAFDYIERRALEIDDNGDLVGMLSVADASNSDFGFNGGFYTKTETRVARNTEYVEACNIYCTTWWWLKTQGDSDNECKALIVEEDGHFDNHGIAVSQEGVAVRPAIHLNLTSGEWYKAGTISSSGVVTDDGAAPTARPVTTVRPVVTADPDESKDVVQNTELINTPNKVQEVAPAVTKVEFESKYMDIRKGATATIPKPKIYPREIKHTNLTWVSADPNICDVDANGNIYAYNYGTTFITVWTENGKQDTITVKVCKPSLWGWKKLELNQKENYTVSYTGNEVEWSLSKKDILKIESKKADKIILRAIKPGKVTLYAKVDGFTLKRDIEVMKPQIKYKRLIIKRGKGKNNLIYKMDSLSDFKVKWKSKNTKIASIPKKWNDVREYVYVMGKKKGKTWITGEIQANKIKYKTTVKFKVIVK